MQDGQAEALELLERAVNINSGTMNTIGVQKVGELFAQAFEDAGFSTRWTDGEAFGRGGHLIAEHGSQGPKVVADRTPGYGVRPRQQFFSAFHASMKIMLQARESLI